MAVSKMTAVKLLETHEHNLFTIKQRYFFLKKYLEQQSHRTKELPILIKNTHINQMLHDTYDMLAIDLASICRGMVGQGGFFNKLNSHLAELKMMGKKDVKPPKGTITFLDHNPSQEEKKKIQEEMDERYTKRFLEGNKDAFYRLFPSVKSRKAKKVLQSDIDDLKQQFYSFAKLVINDRDGHRAHKYESTKHNRAAKHAEKLSVEKIGEVFDKIQDILNDIRLITDKSVFVYSSVSDSSSKETASDLLDLVLLGASTQIAYYFKVNEFLLEGKMPCYDLLREDFYKELHEKYAKRYDLDFSSVALEDNHGGKHENIKAPVAYLNDFR